MPNPEKQISFLIDTIWSLQYNEKINDYLDLLESFIVAGHELKGYGIGDKKESTIIRDLNHFNIFKKSFRNRRIRTT